MDSETFYRERRFAIRVGYGDRLAVLVIDMARAFRDPSFKLRGGL